VPSHGSWIAVTTRVSGRTSLSRRMVSVITPGGGPAPDSSHMGKNSTSPTAWAARAVGARLPRRKPKATKLSEPTANPTVTPAADDGAWTP
jgi:hypothetical protein